MKTNSLSLFLRLFSPKVLIEVTPHLFTFICGNVTLSMPTCVYLNINNIQGKVVVLDKEGPSQPGAFMLDLFENRSIPFQKIDKVDCLAALIRYGLDNVLSKPRFLRPTAIFKGIQTFDSKLLGYQESLFRIAGERAGAAAVLFE